MRLAANLVHGLLLSFSATTALAQEIRVPPIEIGGQLTALGAVGEGLYMRALLGPRVTVNLSQRNSFEVSVDVMTPSYVLLRSPNLDPPLQRVRAVRIRYMWATSSDRSVGTLGVRFNAANSPRADLQLRGSADLRPASTWTETELQVPPYASMYTPLDVNYVYFEGDSASDTGVLKIDSIALMME